LGFFCVAGVFTVTHTHTIAHLAHYSAGSTLVCEAHTL